MKAAASTNEALLTRADEVIEEGFLLWWMSPILAPFRKWHWL